MLTLHGSHKIGKQSRTVADRSKRVPNFYVNMNTVSTEIIADCLQLIGHQSRKLNLVEFSRSDADCCRQSATMAAEQFEFRGGEVQMLEN